MFLPLLFHPSHHPLPPPPLLHPPHPQSHSLSFILLLFPLPLPQLLIPLVSPQSSFCNLLTAARVPLTPRENFWRAKLLRSSNACRQHFHAFPNPAICDNSINLYSSSSATDREFLTQETLPHTHTSNPHSNNGSGCCAQRRGLLCQRQHHTLRPSQQSIHSSARTQALPPQDKMFRLVCLPRSEKGQQETC